MTHMKKNKTLEKQREIQSKNLTLKILTATTAAFIKDSQVLFLEVENEKWLIHKFQDRIMIDQASDYDNFQHGLLIQIREDKDGTFIPEEPKKEYKVKIKSRR